MRLKYLAVLHAHVDSGELRTVGKRTLAMCRQLPTPDVPASLAASVKAAIQAFLYQR